VGSLPALSSDGATVFVGSCDKKVYAICATSGRQKWGLETGNYEFSSPAVSNDGATVFVGSRDKKVYAICATSGTQKWLFQTEDAVPSSPALSSNGATVFVGPFDWKVYALSVKPDWEAIWNLAVSSTSTTPEWGEVKAALAEWELAKSAEDAAKAEWEAAKEAMATAKRAEEAAKNVVCERLVRAQQVEEAAKTEGGRGSAGRGEGGGSSKRAMGECCICLERTATDRLLAFVPCGHKCVCAGCADRLERKPCPICRKNAREVLRVYE
jgi:outer membrane protein assembly factor BamB